VHLLGGRHKQHPSAQQEELDNLRKHISVLQKGTGKNQ